MGRSSELARVMIHSRRLCVGVMLGASDGLAPVKKPEVLGEPATTAMMRPNPNSGSALHPAPNPKP